MKTINPFSLLLMASFCLNSVPALAWGERGHDLVTRVAARLLSEEHPNIGEAMASREHMLAHLSNVPDIHWRASYMSNAEREANSSTHYIDLDLIYPVPEELSQIERDYDEFAELARQRDLDLDTDIGTAPWRVLQLQQDMTAALRDAAKAENRNAMVEASNRALLYAGIMSHFVADLANPHHSTIDHNGVQTGQAGLHAYFETLIVNQLDLSLADEIIDHARDSDLNTLLLPNASPVRRAEVLADPSQLIFALTLDSLRHLDQLRDLDRQHSLLEPSTTTEQRARRKDPADIAADYRSFVVERLALGSLVLSQLWQLAWNDAGQPDLSGYQSYHYWLQPKFIHPQYP